MDYVTPKKKFKVTTMTSAAAVATTFGVDADTAYRIAKAERPLLDVASVVCGLYTLTKTHIITEMLKAADEEGVELARQLIEAVFSCSITTSDWEGSFILNPY